MHVFHVGHFRPERARRAEAGSRLATFRAAPGTLEADVSPRVVRRARSSTDVEEVSNPAPQHI